MAFLQDNNEEQEDQTSQSTQSASITDQPQSQYRRPPTGASKAPQGSGSFVNLQKYVDANKPKAEQLTQKITGNIQSEAQKVGSDIEQQRKQFLGESSQVAQEEQRLDQVTPFYQEAIQKAGSGQLTQEDINRFQNISNAEGVKLTAPELQQQRASAEDLKRRAQQFGTSKGRFEELQKTVGSQSPTYGTGQRSLDELLIAGNRGRQARAVKDVRKATSSFDKQLQDIESSAQDRLSNIAKRRQELAQQAKSQLGQAQQGLTSNIEQARAAKQAEVDQVLYALRTGQNVEALKQAGLEQWSQRFQQAEDPTKDLLTYGAIRQEDIPGLITGSAAQVTREETMSPEQLSRLRALQQLSGQPIENIQLQQEDPYARVRQTFNEIDRRRNIYEQELANEISAFMNRPNNLVQMNPVVMENLKKKVQDRLAAEQGFDFTSYLGYASPESGSPPPIATPTGKGYVPPASIPVKGKI